MDNALVERWLKSLYGCDGGNIQKAKTWICGIEWGYQKATDSQRTEYYTNGLKNNIINGRIDLGDHYDFSKSNEHVFNRQFAKLYTVMKGHSIDDYLTQINKYGLDEVFKMNLFPIAFRRDKDFLWRAHGLQNLFPQFQTKEDYRKACRLHRFAFFRDLVQKHNPEVIICTGIEYASDFHQASSGKTFDQKSQIPLKINDISERNKSDRHYYYWKLDNGTLLFVVPFLVSRYGLNSHILLDKMGKIIKNAA